MTSLGQVKTEGDRSTLIFERHLAHPVNVVWRAITNPSEITKWYLPNARIDARSGGKIEFYDGQGRVTGSVLVWDPPNVLEHEWKVERPGFPEGEYGIIRWELKSDGEETILRLTHRRLPAEIARAFAPGLHAMLDRLESFLDDVPMSDWAKRSEELRPSYLHSLKKAMS